MISAMVLCRFVHFTVVLMLFGTWVFRPLLLNGSAEHLDRRLTMTTRWLAAVALVSGVAWLLLSTASMAGAWEAAVDPSTLHLVLGNTFFGQVWRWHLLLNALLVALLMSPWRAHTLCKSASPACCWQPSPRSVTEACWTASTANC